MSAFDSSTAASTTIRWRSCGVAADSTAAVQAAEAKGVYAVAYHSDMSKYGPKAHLTAVTHQWGDYYTKTVQAAVEGKWKPGSIWGGIKEGMIKMAPFNRYRTLDVIRGVVEAGAEDRVTLYTGNDDHIVADLLSPFTFVRDGKPVTVRIRGGLLGHWSVWTHAAVQLLDRIHAAVAQGSVPMELLALDAQVTDCNSALFDVAHDFHGCIAGCHEVLRRQGLLEGIWCLDPNETLSPGQAGEIDRVLCEHADLADDAFVRVNLERWLA